MLNFNVADLLCIVLHAEWFGGLFYWAWTTAPRGQADKYGFTTNGKPASALFKEAFTSQVPPVPPVPPPPPCTDEPPPHPGKKYGCAQQRQWGKCDVKQFPWMKGYCCLTCFNCTAGCGNDDVPAKSSANPMPLLPKWSPTYDLQRSLAAMPCNESGWSDSALFSQLGIVTYDMNNAHDIWEKNVPSNPEEVLEQQCAMTKRHSPDVKCGVYRNSAHMWSNYVTVRKALQNRSLWGFFLPWANTTARNYSAGGAGENLYYDTVQSPHAAVAPWNGKCQCIDQNPHYGAHACNGSEPQPICECGLGLPCGQFMFDFRNDSLVSWLNSEYLGGALGLGSPNVDFFFLDDSWEDPSGPTEVVSDSRNHSTIYPIAESTPAFLFEPVSRVSASPPTYHVHVSRLSVMSFILCFDC